MKHRCAAAAGVRRGPRLAGWSITAGKRLPRLRAGLGGQCARPLSAAASTQALAAQAQRLLKPSPAFFNDAGARAGDDSSPQLSGLPRVFLASSGAEANEGAIKLARKLGRARIAAAPTRSSPSPTAFHGRTLATMAATGKAGWDRCSSRRCRAFRRRG
ncbi:MAG: aminotransferase class III-fold pyridoxal phosphate-dependent enzyme [Comamonadaceae bacterium]|nr:aminotransferase class III-fold pyridoxal phosphate-dependent enzyme [Comamonadaceae bacterium]